MSLLHSLHATHCMEAIQPVAHLFLFLQTCRDLLETRDLLVLLDPLDLEYVDWYHFKMILDVKCLVWYD